jgi:cell division protein FtsW (lipid II flippase)
MKNKASSHLFIFVFIVALTFVGYYGIHRAALIRGYETSWIMAVRDLFLFLPLIALLLFFSIVIRYKGNWTIFTTAVLLFSIGMLVQYRLFSDPEYIAPSKKKGETHEMKADAQRYRFIAENYSADKKRLMGLPATPPTPADLDTEEHRQSQFSLINAFTASSTLIPLFSIFCFFAAFMLFVRDDILNLIQRNGFIIVLLTIVPLIIAVVTSRAGKSLFNMTPWELSKIPFLIGFASILTAKYKDLAKTYWGVPSLKDVVPLIVMGAMPFIPFFALKDFGQMLVFSGAYATLYLVAVRRIPQLFVFVGSLVLAISILVIGALPVSVQSQIPLLPTIAKPVKLILPNRIQQRFHLWLDGFNPPPPETSWWKNDYEEALEENPKLKELARQSQKMQDVVNVDIWFDRLAYQPAQAIFGVSSGGTMGRGLGLGFVEIIPVADSDYIYAAIGEELGLAGGFVIILLLIVFVAVGVRTSLDARDMFTKLCSAGLTAFICFQALVNIGGITRTLPMTGITLPFVSHGGFSLLTSFIMLGMLMAFSHRNGRDAIVNTKTNKVNKETSKTSIPEAVQ